MPFERVYFIGAGFSTAMHYPVGQDLMSCLVGYLRGETDKRYRVYKNYVLKEANGRKLAKKILRVIERVLETYFATKLSAIDRVDVAEFFTLAQMLSERSWLHDVTPKARTRGMAYEPSETTLFDDLAAITRSFFVGLSRGYDYPDDVDAMLRVVRPRRDAVINFNWDEDVEIFFSSGVEEDVCYTLGAWHPGDHETLVLKPHGSIGWYDVQRGIGNKDAYLIAKADRNIKERYEKRIVAYMANELPRDIDGKSFHSALRCPPVITAPTFAKRFDYIEQQQIWNDVLTVCRDANDFVFLGYSLPKDDFLTRAAIRAAIAQNRARRIRCLIVDRTFEGPKQLNFLSVFEGLSPDRNYLHWEFGSDDKGLGKQVLQKLSRAYVATA